MHAVNRCLVVLPLPRHAESAAADLAASSLGLGIPVLPIEGARTYAPGISMGTVAVFPAFSTPSPAAFGRSRLPWSPYAPRSGRSFACSENRVHLYTVVFGARGCFLPALGSMVDTVV